MELIERYIEAVVRYLPPRQRSGIIVELRSLIEDMLRQRTGDRAPVQADVEAVLLELGNPRRLADSYRGPARSLISPAFFELYWLVLRIVLAATGGGILLATALEMAANPPDNAWMAVARILGSLYNALIGAFGIVTLIFALNDRFNDQGREQIEKLSEKWHPSQLPPRTVSNLVIKRADPIAAIVIMVIAMIVINVNIELIGIYFVADGTMTITPLLSEFFAVFLPWLNLSIGLAIIIEGIKLITGRWTMPLVVGSLVQKTLGLVITLQMFADTKIFNPGFFNEINRIFRAVATPLPADLPARICQVIVIVAIVGFAIDLLSTGWKGVRIMFRMTGVSQAVKK